MNGLLLIDWKELPETEGGFASWEKEAFPQKHWVRIQNTQRSKFNDNVRL